MEVFDLYKDIEARTKGTIYLGVVGPVRTGKSTFIKRFMDIMVLPKIKDLNSRERAKDEMPQSASGKTVMTAEPKFVPKDGVLIPLADDIKVNIRLVDCVGYMIECAVGHMENGIERKVKTPWYDEEIPFTKAAAIGTQKVIRDHATIGVVVTTDGSIGEIERNNYLDAEEKTILELQKIGKPFVVLVNSIRPYGKEAKDTVDYLKEKFHITALAVNCEQMREDEIHKIMENILLEFPITELKFYIPKWVEMLPAVNSIKKQVLDYACDLLASLIVIKDVWKGIKQPEETCIDKVEIKEINLASGDVKVDIHIAEKYYYQMISDMVGLEIKNEYDLLRNMKEMAELRTTYDEVSKALESVKTKGYGVVNPLKEEIVLDDPILIKQGSKYGVKIHSEAPSIHMIKANIETEIAPIVGNEQQANDLIQYIKNEAKQNNGIWNTNIFGKTVEELVKEGINNKLMLITDESQIKLQDTMQKIVNESNGGMVCIII